VSRARAGSGTVVLDDDLDPVAVVGDLHTDAGAGGVPAGVVSPI
jgi:hypothetical protein